MEIELMELWKCKLSWEYSWTIFFVKTFDTVWMFVFVL